MTRCPECGDHLLGFTMTEAMHHLAGCDRSPGRRVIGVDPEKADELYRSWSGRDPPDAMADGPRMKWYSMMNYADPKRQ